VPTDAVELIIALNEHPKKSIAKYNGDENVTSNAY